MAAIRTALFAFMCLLVLFLAVLGACMCSSARTTSLVHLRGRFSALFLSGAAGVNQGGFDDCAFLHVNVSGLDDT